MPDLMRPGALSTSILGAALVFLGTTGAFPLSSQQPSSGELSGRVVDSETGDPVSQAVVVLDRRAGRSADGGGVGRRQSITDEDGRFELLSVPAGMSSPGKPSPRRLPTAWTSETSSTGRLRASMCS